MPASGLFRDYMVMIGFNEPVTKKAQFWTSYVSSLQGKIDLRAHACGGESNRCRDGEKKYTPYYIRNFGLSPRFFEKVAELKKKKRQQRRR